MLMEAQRGTNKCKFCVFKNRNNISCISLIFFLILLSSLVLDKRLVLFKPKHSSSQTVDLLVNWIYNPYLGMFRNSVLAHPAW